MISSRRASRWKKDFTHPSIDLLVSLRTLYSFEKESQLCILSLELSIYLLNTGVKMAEEKRRVIRYIARIPKLEETEISKYLAANPEAKKRHDEIVAKLREEARPEIEALRRSERLTAEDYNQRIG
jgi:hypothetical protein